MRQKKKLIVGVKSGLYGAMTILGDTSIHVYTYEDPTGLIYLKNIKKKFAPVFYIEKATPTHTPGVPLALKYGIVFGIWLGRCQVLGIPVKVVNPVDWHRKIFTNLRKDHSHTYISIDPGERIYKKPHKIDSHKKALSMAHELYPELSHIIDTHREHRSFIAQSILIARYGQIEQQALDDLIA